MALTVSRVFFIAAAIAFLLFAFNVSLGTVSTLGLGLVFWMCAKATQ